MRNYLMMAAVAPIALVAACAGDADEGETTDADATTVASSENDPTAAEDDYTPGPATALADAGDYSGNYSYTADDGKEYGVRLNSSDKTYTYFGPDGLQRTGDYTWTPDGFRIRIDEFDAGPAWFTIREGSLIRLNEDTEVDAEMTVEGDRYRRDDDNAMFSRFPEIGSPVTPQD